ncbi:MAG: hypothetical protein ABR979_05545 [Halobacteriota archaeon]
MPRSDEPNAETITIAGITGIVIVADRRLMAPTNNGYPTTHQIER